MPKQQPPKTPARPDVPRRPETSPPARRVVLAFLGQKGGVGKTTTTIAVAAEWHARGRKVLVVDTDPQGSARTWASVAGDFGTDIPTVVAMGEGLEQPGQLPRLAAEHEVTVVDCPPRLADVQRAVLMVADLVILPCGPSTMDTWALKRSLKLVRSAQVLRPELRAVVLVTRLQPNTVLGRELREILAAAEVPVLGSQLCLRVTYQEAPAAGLGPTTLAPESAAAAEVRALCDELEALWA
ncbi:MAG: hypothetical protein JWM10_3319 [Myxococcaceae bacterium]|nr:hypothetical protein [Myxococcaceae bacterium]